MKNEMPKANEFQLSKLKMRVSSILKQQSITEPTLENVRAAMDQAKKEINIQPNAIPQTNTIPVQHSRTGKCLTGTKTPS